MISHRPAARRRRPLLSALLVLATAACVSPRPRGYDPAPGTIVLRVINRGWSDAVVYVADGNVPFRLGRVPALDRAQLAIPNQFAALGVRLIVRAAGSDRRYAAEPVLPGAGGVVELIVQPLLLSSEVTVLSYGNLGR